MSTTGAAKICEVCKQDCSNRPRGKDAQGRYTCKDCAAKLAGAKGGGAPSKAGSTSGAQPPDAFAVALAGVDQTSMTPCPGCGVLLRPGSVLCTACGYDLQKGRAVRTRVEALSTGSGKSAAAVAGKLAVTAGATALAPVFWIIGALVGGAVGAGIWAGISAGTGYEVGYIAALVGITTGVGAAIGSRGRGGVMPGLVAVVVAIGAVLAGKYYAASYVVEKVIRQERHNITAVSDQEAIAHIADEMATEKESGGATLDWPEGERPPYPADPAGYPSPIVKEARQKWAKADADWKQDYTNRISRDKNQLLNDNKEAIKTIGFLATFGILDLLWFPLAIVSAYRAGSRSQSEP